MLDYVITIVHVDRALYLKTAFKYDSVKKLFEMVK